MELKRYRTCTNDDDEDEEEYGSGPARVLESMRADEQLQVEPLEANIRHGTMLYKEGDKAVPERGARMAMAN